MNASSLTIPDTWACRSLSQTSDVGRSAVATLNRPIVSASTDGPGCGRLAALRTLTQSVRATLDPDHLLVEMLNRVREALVADTAAVLLLEEHAGVLVARAACGVEDEVRQGVRVPVGTGFAGRIAATRRPVRLDHVDSTTVSNPVLWKRGIKVMVGVPLLLGDDLIGVLHVGRLEHDPFTEEDAKLLQAAGALVASAITACLPLIERTATMLLERSLLPTKLPSCPGLAFATRFLAAEHRTVGGDWYDLFTTGSGRLWIIVGDVAGHGLEAAVVMGRIRSAMRAYCLLDEPPERVLDLVDRKVKHFEASVMATVACAVLDPPYDTMTVAVAGHPPPVIAAAGQATLLAEVEPGPPIGIDYPAERRSTRIQLAPDSVVAFYTDGLIERRGESLDVGISRLQQAVTVGSPDDVAHDIMSQLVASYPLRDDVALVVMGRTSIASTGRGEAPRSTAQRRDQGTSSLLTAGDRERRCITGCPSVAHRDAG